MTEAASYLSRTDEPHEIYHDVLVSIDENRDLNNGQPSLWAFVFDQLDIREGDTVLQVGAGVGYFTAILAEITGPAGRVIAFEIDPELAKRASRNLAGYPQIDFSHGDAVHAGPFPELDQIVSFAGATHPPKGWLDSLSPKGRMMLPLTAADHNGFMMLLEHIEGRYRVRSLGACGYYHCKSARTEIEGARLRNVLDNDTEALALLDELFVGQADETASGVWFSGNQFWISKRPA